ncbi:MAG: hypothetical protein LBM98_04690 [Oscillospiraceae bacterium]|nr:hypothetical protein [Oscillospiraceae bacterium]
MLRTCNVLRIVGLPVLRNDGGGRFANYGGLDVGTGLGLLRAARNDGARRRETTPPPAGGTPPKRGIGRGQDEGTPFPRVLRLNSPLGRERTA